MKVTNEMKKCVWGGGRRRKGGREKEKRERERRGKFISGIGSCDGCELETKIQRAHLQVEAQAGLLGDCLEGKFLLFQGTSFFFFWLVGWFALKVFS